VAAHRLEIAPLSKAPVASIRVPGSKSITNRALVLAALTNGPETQCVLRGALFSEDTTLMIECLEALGFQLEARRSLRQIRFHDDPANGKRFFPQARADLFVGNSGTTMRFLTALVSLGHGVYRLDGISRMRERPIGDLLHGLRQLGVRAVSEGADGFPPVRIDANGLKGGLVRMKGNVSSQFLSGLLMVAAFADDDVSIHVEETLVSRPYVDMTLAMMRQFGLAVEADGDQVFHIPGRQTGGLISFDVEPDASAASYFLAAAAITRGKVSVPGIGPRSLQGDARFAEVLGAMGCRVVQDGEGLTIAGGPLHGIDVDMNEISDCVMTLAAVACFARGPTTIRNVAHIRHKETDRLRALATELRRLGAGVEEADDGLTILPGPLHGAVIETYNDHRIAMSMALVGLSVPGIVIRDPGCVAKTYPDFFEDLEKLRG